jgi:sterol desaturase/sphingolipid hydroxylase (fatty acid hydroxylase superfamily)
MPSFFDRLVGIGFIGFVVVGIPSFFRQHPGVWNYLIQMFGNGNDKYAFCNGSLFFHCIFWLLFNGSLGILYASSFNVVEKFKTITNDPWPWKSPKESERNQFWKLLKNSLLLIAFNNICLSYPSTLLTFDSARRNNPTIFSLSWEDFPSTGEICWQFVVFILVEDAMFYWSHRLLHIPFLFRRIHKIHHKYHHTIGVASECAHPVEYYIGNMLPFSTGPLLVGAHSFTFWLWLFVRLGKTAEAHCGYSFPFSPFQFLPFANPSEAHDYHHSTGFTSCYGSFLYLWDTVCGTNKEFMKKQSIKSE